MLTKEDKLFLRKVAYDIFNKDYSPISYERGEIADRKVYKKPEERVKVYKDNAEALSDVTDATLKAFTPSGDLSNYGVSDWAKDSVLPTIGGIYDAWTPGYLGYGIDKLTDGGFTSTFRKGPSYPLTLATQLPLAMYVEGKGLGKGLTWAGKGLKATSDATKLTNLASKVPQGVSKVAKPVANYATNYGLMQFRMPYWGKKMGDVTSSNQRAEDLNKFKTMEKDIKPIEEDFKNWEKQTSSDAPTFDDIMEKANPNVKNHIQKMLEDFENTGNLPQDDELSRFIVYLSNKNRKNNLEEAKNNIYEAKNSIIEDGNPLNPVKQGWHELWHPTHVSDVLCPVLPGWAALPISYAEGKLTNGEGYLPRFKQWLKNKFIK